MTQHTGPAGARTTHRRADRTRNANAQDRSLAARNSAGRKSSPSAAGLQASISRYLELARQAESAGDKVSSENYYQHAEHYFRMAQGETV